MMSAQAMSSRIYSFLRLIFIFPQFQKRLDCFFANSPKFREKKLFLPQRVQQNRRQVEIVGKENIRDEVVADKKSFFGVYFFANDNLNSFASARLVAISISFDRKLSTTFFYSFLVTVGKDKETKFLAQAIQLLRNFVRNFSIPSGQGVIVIEDDVIVMHKVAKINLIQRRVIVVRFEFVENH